MITGVFHQGSGLGNQLHRYVATRVRALDLGTDWQMTYVPDGPGKDEGFKGRSFMELDPRIVSTPTFTQQYQEKKTTEQGVDVRGFDPEFRFVQPNTLIDGEFQDERYWEHREKEVDEWLKVKPVEMPDDLCVIGFRGGEFALYPDLFLTRDYWIDAIGEMRKVNPDMKFIVHSDDPKLALNYFLALGYNFPVIHEIGVNWRSMRYAKYAIIANSSFFILPRWLNKGLTLAPRYWGRRNTKVWSLPQNYYSRFTYL